MRFKLTLGLTMLICLTATTFINCAGRPYLIVDYQLPPASQKLSGQTVHLHIKDLRKDQSILTPSAAEEFSGFKDRYSLAWVLENKERILAGEYDLQSLLLKAFQKRIERLGVEITSDAQSHVLLFEVVLKKFKIDLQGRKWIASVSYEANLSRDSHLIARETVTGNAERVKIIGRKGADKALSEIFSDILNRLDIHKLFQQAMLDS